MTPSAADYDVSSRDIVTRVKKLGKTVDMGSNRFARGWRMQ